MGAKISQQYCKLGKTSQTWGDCRAEGRRAEGKGQEASWGEVMRAWNPEENKRGTEKIWAVSWQINMQNNMLIITIFRFHN